MWCIQGPASCKAGQLYKHTASHHMAFQAMPSQMPAMASSKASQLPPPQPTNRRYNDTDIIDIIKHYSRPEQDAELKRISRAGQEFAAKWVPCKRCLP